MQTRLKISQILEVFPDEVKKLAPREARRIRKEIKWFEDYFTSLYKQPYDKFTKHFIAEVVRVCYMPHRRLNSLVFLHRIIKMAKQKEKPKAGNISDQDIQRAKDVPIISFVHARRLGRKHMATCPLHAEKHPSLYINENNTAKCFSCGFFGDSIELIQQMHNLSFIEAVKYLNGGVYA